MPDLVAQGTEPRSRWRRRLPLGAPTVIGRQAGPWSITWDDRISRQHVEICWRAAGLEVKVLEGAKNPVFYTGKPQNAFYVKPGEHFVIGQTTFTLSDDHAQVSLDLPLPAAEHTFSIKQLKLHRFRDVPERMDMLSRLPELITSASGDAELCMRVVNVVLGGVPSATGAAVVQLTRAGAPVEVFYWDRRKLSGGDFHPSDRLIRQAVERGESVVHTWSPAAERGAAAFTLSEDIDWAFCTPLSGEACKGWAIYVAGAFAGEGAPPTSADPQALRDDLKFTELVASMLGNLRELRLLEKNRTSLGQFFSPVVMEQLAGQDPEQVLKPREADVAVLFCDLRGFARKSEQAGANLIELLNRVSRALGVMTHHILDQGGVVGDFHGDAAMGFWGWPIAQDDAVARACHAALGIRAEFVKAADETEHPLAHFQMGIGIASGRAVAGKIGTVDQVKVTVFGPVVNLASRLESMTKHLRAPILLDDASAQAVRANVPRSVFRTRRVAVVKPYGLATPVEVSELLPPAASFPLLADEHLLAYEAALDAFLARDWEAAFQLLHHVPAVDRVKDFLTVFIAQHSRMPPDNWDGAIPLATK